MDLERRFFNDDFRSISSERKKFESEIRKTNSKNAYTSYINYEIMIWKKIKSKCNESSTNFSEAIAKKIINLHNVALSYFKDDLNLWLSFIKFCMEANYHGLLSDAFSRMLTYRTDKHLWLLAAKWEIDEYENIEKAIEYLHRALSHHSEESSIYTEIFRLELESSRYLSDLSNLQKIEENSLAKALKIFNTVQNKIPNDVDLCINLLNIATQYNFTEKLQTEIIKHMIAKFPKNENVWYILAKRELQGHHLTIDNNYKYINSSVQSRLENLVKKFQNAVNLIKTDTMWTKFLNTLLDLQEDQNYDFNYLKNSFMQACEKAHEDKLLSEEHYIRWIEYLHNNPRLPQILEDATRNKPKCLQLWVARIRCHIVTCEEDKIEEIFDDAIKILGDDSVQIWRLKIQYYQLNLNIKDTSKIENLYRAGLEFSSTVSKLLKPQFLNWIALFKQNVTREEYKKIATQEPYSLELHKKMIELEAMCSHPNIENLELISKLATEQFGKEAWLEYIQEEIDCGPRWKKEIFRKYLRKE